MSRKVTLAAPYTDRGGKKHEADATVELPDGDASNLLHLGLAREPQQGKAAAKAGQAKSEKGA